jgi:Chaperone of endosialidase
LSKSKVGLGNVDNTADSTKSVSYATTAGSAGSATSATTATTSTYSTYLSPISGQAAYKLAYTADGQRTNAGDWGRVVMRYDNNGQTYGVRVDRADYSDTCGTAGAAPWSGITSKPTTVSGYGISDMSSQSVNYASSSTYSTYLSSSQQQNSIIGAYSSMPMTSGGGASGSFICRASGSGDYSLAGITFWNDSYAIRMGIRDDGYFGLGGWSRSAWSWYSDPSGNMVAAGNVTAYSDPRLKENFTRVQNALGGGKFTWKQGFKHTEMKAGKEDYGILADQVEAVLPELVTDSIDIEGETYKTVAYEKLIPVLIEAIKELKAEIDVLKGQIK